MVIRIAIATMLLVGTTGSSSHSRLKAEGFHGRAEISDCSVLKTVVLLAQRSRVPIGIEQRPSDCWNVPPPFSTTGPTRDVDVKQALSQLVKDAPDYEWRDMGGVMVIRPAESWDNPEHFLTRPVKSFAASGWGAGLQPALAALSDPVRPRYFRPSIDTASIATGVRPDPRRLMFSPPRPDPTQSPLTMSFGGGDLLDALNAMIRGRDSVGWMINYCGSSAALDTAILTISLRDASIGRSGLLGLASQDGHTNPCLNLTAR